MATLDLLANTLRNTLEARIEKRLREPIAKMHKECGRKGWSYLSNSMAGRLCGDPGKKLNISRLVTMIPECAEPPLYVVPVNQKPNSLPNNLAEAFALLAGRFNKQGRSRSIAGLVIVSREDGWLFTAYNIMNGKKWAGGQEQLRRRVIAAQPLLSTDCKGLLND